MLLYRLILTDSQAKSAKKVLSTLSKLHDLRKSPSVNRLQSRNLRNLCNLRILILRNPALSPEPTSIARPAPRKYGRDLVPDLVLSKADADLHCRIGNETILIVSDGVGQNDWGMHHGKVHP